MRKFVNSVRYSTGKNKIKFRLEFNFIQSRRHVFNSVQDHFSQALPRSGLEKQTQLMTPTLTSSSTVVKLR